MLSHSFLKFFPIHSTMHQSMKQKSLSVVRLRLSATISELACRRNFFSSSKKKQGLSEIDSSKQHDASNLQVAAHREVRIARRQHREAQDEINLYNSSIIEGTLPASNPEDKNLRKIVINNWVDHQVKSFMKDLSNGMQRPSIAKHDLVVSQSVTCPDGFGEGLFVANGNIPRGSIVAFYPGATYTANEVRWAGSYAKLFDLVKLEDRSYLLGREGGTIFDGASALEGASRARSASKLADVKFRSEKSLYDAERQTRIYFVPASCERTAC